MTAHTPTAAGTRILGSAIKRREDPRLMTGQATYVETLTCLELLRDARKLPQDSGTVGLGDTVGRGRR